MKPPVLRLLVPGTALAVLIGLVVLGRAAAPPWAPPPLPPDLRYPPLPAADPGPQPPAGGVVREDTAVQVDGERLAATVVAPDRPGPHPAVVFVHGGGAGKRDAFADQAEHLARHGIVALVHDKRTVGYSPVRRDYAQLAADARAAADVLRGRPDVDPGRIGLWGTSEGGWVVPLAAAADPRLAFVILVNAPAMSPLQQSTWSLDAGLRRIGVPDRLRQAAIRAFDLGGFDYVQHDPAPALRGVRQPALVLQGTADAAIPPVESPRRLAEALAAGGSTVRFFDGADHGMRVGGRLAPGYLETITAWVHGLPDLPPPPVAGAAPHQEHLSATVSPPWYAGGAAHAVAFALVLGGLLAAPVAGVVRRLRGPAAVEPARLRRRLRWLAGSTVGTVLAQNTALGTAIGLAAAGAGGGAPAAAAWYLARLLAAATVVQLVAAAFAVRSGRRQGWRPRGVERARVYGVLGAASVVSLLAAYWLA